MAIAVEPGEEKRDAGIEALIEGGDEGIFLLRGDRPTLLQRIDFIRNAGVSQQLRPGQKGGAAGRRRPDSAVDGTEIGAGAGGNGKAVGANRTDTGNALSVFN